MARQGLSSAFRVVLMSAACAAAACGGGSDPSPAAPSPTAPPSSGGEPTLSITADGVSPRELRVNAGMRVRIANNDSRPRHIQSNPHPTHGDCPALNRPGLLSPGASGLTDPFSEERLCGYHDHATNNEDARYRGVVIVGASTPPPQNPDDYY